MTDIEHAKKYAEESISLAISMYNPKAEVIAETACLYGLTFKNKQIAELERKLEQTEKDLADYQFNYPTIKELQKENARLKEINTHTLSKLNLDNGELIIENEKLKKELNEWKDKADLWCNTANLKDHNIMINKELEKENAELKDNFKIAKDNEYEYSSLLTKAKEIIKELLNSCFGYNSKTVNYEVKAKAEQFLKNNA